MMKKTATNSQSGVVSLLTVIFMMIFISLITVGFIGLVTQNHRRTIDNELSSSALAAARNGIEDGKRILLYCAQNPTAAECNDGVLNNTTNCQAFKAGGPGAGIAGKLGLSVTDTGEILNGGAAAKDYQQYYTCLMIQKNTPFVSSTITADDGYIQELKGVSAFNRLQVTWSDDQGSFSNTGLTTNWPTYGDWNSQRFPPVIELQIVTYREGDFTTGSDPLTAIENQSRTLYIVPCGAASPGCGTQLVNMLTTDLRETTPGSPRPGATPPIAYAKCNFSSGYSCSLDINLASMGSQPDRHYYARLALHYGVKTEINLSLKQGATVVNFAGVQPWIDVTGRTNDVFRRIRAQVQYGQQQMDSLLPQYALESARPICKIMAVTPNAATTSYGCN